MGENFDIAVFNSCNAQTIKSNSVEYNSCAARIKICSVEIFTLTVPGTNCFIFMEFLSNFSNFAQSPQKNLGKF